MQNIDVPSTLVKHSEVFPCAPCSWTIPPSTTLLALLGRLEGKGYVTREKQGKGYLYAAALAREAYLPVESRSALERMFGGSAKNLIAAMAQTKDLSKEDIDELTAYLEELKQGGH